MKRAMRLAVLVMPFVVSMASAQVTDWWNAAYNSPGMLNKDQASRWRAENGDTLSKIVMASYGIPADKPSSALRVVDAVIAYNNALLANKSLYNADKVTPIVDKNLIYAGKSYFLPDPRSIDRIMRGENPATVMQESLASAANAAQARGEADAIPMHAMGPIEAGVSDADAPTMTPTPTPTATGNGTPVAPILGGWNGQGVPPPGQGQGVPPPTNAELAALGRTDMMGVPSASGPTPAEGTTAQGDRQRGNVPLICMWDYVNAEPVTKTAGPLKGSAATGVTIGNSN